MGSCSGKPLHHDAVVTLSPNKTEGVHHATASHERHSNTASVPTPHTPTAKIGSLEVSDSEEFESAGSPEEDRQPSPHGPLSTTGTYEEFDKLKGGDDDVNADLPKPKLRVGYSSGGSSSTLEGDEIRHASSSSHLLELKHSLSAGGDLCKGVVRIETDFGRPIEEVYEGVHDGPVLGSGVSGVVRRVKHRKTGVNYAAKCLDLGLIVNEEKAQALRDEIAIMCQLDHPNIVRLEEVYESETEIFLIQELCLGGDLFDRLEEQSNFHYSEAKCARLVKQMLSAVRYLHSKNITHRDLKLENFLFSSTEPDSELRMIDFGLSKHFDNFGDLHYEMVGTPYTVAPEMFKGKYDEKVDIWAMGVITYLLVSGETPFGGVDGESLISVRARIMKGRCEFVPAKIWDHVSDQAKAFIKRLLDPDSSNRPTAKEAQLDPWLQTFGKKDIEKGNCLSPSLCQALIEFKEYSNMRKFLCEVLSYTLLPEQIVYLRQEFEKVDPDGEGEISLATLKEVLLESAEEGALGALTEDEVEGLFDALRVRKTEAKIRWHEFIAAGLSQCSFDDRNLRLAFDRLDFEQKGFITLTDMKGLLGTAEDEENEALSKMWEDGLAEFVCPLGRITFDDFRMFVKGQKREKEPNSPIPRRVSKRLTIDMSPLQAVPEGSMSPQTRHHVFAKLDEMSGLESLKLPLMGTSATSPIINESGDIDTPERKAIPYLRKNRSRSLGETPLPTDFMRDIREVQASTNAKFLRSVGLRSKSIGELAPVISEEYTSARELHQALYQKHRQFRQSVIAASKLFDQKQKARKFQAAVISNDRRPEFNTRASLVMRRGAPHPQMGEDPVLMPKSEHVPRGNAPERPPPPSNEVSPDNDDDRKVTDASRRGGRPRRPRQKTTSDISGMLR